MARSLWLDAEPAQLTLDVTGVARGLRGVESVRDALDLASIAPRINHAIALEARVQIRSLAMNSMQIAFGCPLRLSSLQLVAQLLTLARDAGKVLAKRAFDDLFERLAK